MHIMCSGAPVEYQVNARGFDVGQYGAKLTETPLGKGCFHGLDVGSLCGFVVLVLL